MVFAVIVAGGTGTRMGADIPKQFLMLGDEPILIRTLRPFLAPSLCDLICIGVHPDWMDYAGALMEKYLPEAAGSILLTPGGRDRNETLRNAVTAVEERFVLTNDDILLSHDAVRPFIDASLIRETVRAAADYRVSSVAAPSVDTLYVSEDGLNVNAAADRNKIFRTQTPQAARILEWKQLYDEAAPEEKACFTDACGMFLAKGIPVRIVPGSNENLKLTVPEDLKLAEGLCRQ